MSEDRSPRLVWNEDGAPVSGRFGDVYFSREDGLAETRAVFLEGCGLPDAWADRRRFTVAELGFGTGLNIAALLELWRKTRPDGARLNIFSIEGFPLSRDEAARALSAWPELTEATQALLDGWPPPTSGFHRIDLPGFDAVLDLAIGEAAWALSQWSGPADAWFLDGFAPSTNPGMWSDAIFDAIAARSAPGARVATFTVAGVVRRGLADRGFTVEKKPGHGRKRERLEARAVGRAPEEGRKTVAIIGAGIAGASLARAFADLGVRATVFEATAPGAGGSGFPAALVTPRLDAGDRDIAALHAAALERAGPLYAAVPGAILARGVTQLAQADRDAARYARVASQDLWPIDAMAVLDAASASKAVAEPVDASALRMGDALAIKPAAILSAWLDTAEVVTARVAAIRRDGPSWTLSDEDGVVAEADVVVLASGWSDRMLADLPLAPVRGQADWTEGGMTTPIAWGGYAVPTGDGVLFGATHERGETTVETSDAASAKNRQTLAARLPVLAADLTGRPPHRRAAIRATTPDRLPLAGALEPGLLVLTGLGSRGFCVAPLLAEHVAALALNAPSPVAVDQARRVDPRRIRRDVT